MGPFNSLNSDDSCSYICQEGEEGGWRKGEEGGGGGREEGGGGGREEGGGGGVPYIINDIISTTLSTKQMHKSRRPSQ